MATKMEKVNLILSPIETGNEVYAELVTVDYGQAAVLAWNVSVPVYLVGKQIAETDTLCVPTWMHPDVPDLLNQC